jgi:hypothetical protein
MLLLFVDADFRKQLMIKMMQTRKNALNFPSSAATDGNRNAAE